jgi:hypothetical protein
VTDSPRDQSGVQTEPVLPALHESFDASAATNQTRFLRLTRASLVATVIAAAGGALSLGDGPDWAAVMALLAFIAAGGCRLLLLQDRPERSWYDARAGAESVKTLSWQYAVGGGPFPRDGREKEHRQHLTERFRELVRANSSLRRGPNASKQEITHWMRELRATPLAKRRDAYFENRILDQISWYSATAALNDRRARQWSIATLVLYALGVLAATLRVTGTIHFDLLGLAAAAATAATAWLGTKAYSGLAEAYTTTAHELALVRDERADDLDEARWATFVADAEAAISREHTSWLARRRSTRSGRTTG